MIDSNYTVEQGHIAGIWREWVAISGRFPDQSEYWALRMAAGDRDAFRLLYDRYGGGIHKLALRRLADPSEAEEVVQDVFVRVWQARHVWEESRGSFEPWLFVVARNIIYDRLRQQDRSGRKVWAVGNLDWLAPDQGSFVDDVLSADSMQGMLRRLPRDQAEVVRLVYVDGLSTRQIAEEIRVPQGTVKSRLRLAIRHLRRQLQREAE